MPVIDRDLTVYGYTARKLDEQRGTKTLSFLDESRGSWYSCPYSLQLVIVEDQLSAIRLSKYVNAVALLGSDITDALRVVLEDSAFAPISLALDRDAYRKSLKIAMRLKSRLKMNILKLGEDLKDLSEDELIQFLLDNKVIKANSTLNAGRPAA